MSPPAFRRPFRRQAPETTLPPSSTPSPMVTRRVVREEAVRVAAAGDVVARLGYRPHVVMVGTSKLSHVYPGLPLIRELVRRGHRVTFAIGEPLAETVAATGATILPCTSVLPDDDGPQSAWPTDAVETTSLFVDEGINLLPQLRAALDDDRPDIVLFDTAALAGEVAASRWGVPSLEIAVSMVRWGGLQAEQATAYALEAFRAAPGGAACLDRRLAWSAREGAGFDLERIQRGPDDTLVLIPPLLQPYSETVPPSRRFVGPLFDEVRMAAERWEPPHGVDRPIVYVSLGDAFRDQPEIYRACVERLTADYYVVVATGKHIDPGSFGEPSDNVELHRWAPQLGVLRRAQAFVTRGGMASVVEALWFGVPMVVVPQATDHLDNGERIKRLGLGHRLPAEMVSGESLNRHVRGIVDDLGVRMQMARFSPEVRASGSVQLAADVVEELVPAR